MDDIAMLIERIDAQAGQVYHETAFMTKLLDQIDFSFDVKKLDLEELESLSAKRYGR